VGKWWRNGGWREMVDTHMVENGGHPHGEMVEEMVEWWIKWWTPIEIH